MATNIDYSAPCFKYRTPTPINSKPANKTLKRIKTESRASASSVDDNLGGDYGYPALILSDAEYARITPTPTEFVAPNFHIALTIDALATAVVVVQGFKTHIEKFRVYHECKHVEKLFFGIYTMLVDKDTVLIEYDIPTVLQYLFKNYGKVQSEEVKQEEVEVLTIVFNPADPMVLTYRTIEQLQKLATTASLPYSEVQILEFGLTLIQSTRDFEKALGDWNSKATVEKSWKSVKKYFNDA